MNAGSKRVTVRVGDELLERIDEQLEIRNAQGGGVQQWNRSDYIVAAIIEKLNHAQRSRRKQAKVKQLDREENTPRGFEWEGWDEA